MNRIATICKKILKWSLIGSVSLVAILYSSFLAIMIITENSLLEDAPFHASIDFRSRRPHELTLVDEGARSLSARLKIINEAKQTLDLEFFIYDLDSTSRVFTQALAAKSREGVKVRILVDFSLAVFKLAPAYAHMLRDAGVEVKYYNTASIIRFFKVQHRTHRKIVLADNEVAIIGGRNIADDYFDLSHHYNFLDTDLIVRGPAVGAMQERFNLYWNSPWALSPDDSGWEKDRPVINDFLSKNEADAATLASISELNNDLKSTTCNDIRFVTDYPGSGVNYRKVFPAIVEELDAAKSEVFAESPYFVLRSDGAAMVKNLTSRGVRLSILTNSLKSTDAFYTVAPLFPSLTNLAMNNFRLYAYSGNPPTAYDSISNRSDRWGVHSKRGVIDESTVLIGTYNIDPRSANLNSELMVVCRGNRDLAMQVKNSILARIEQSAVVLEDEREPNGDALIGGASWNSLIMMFISIPVSKVFEFLL